MCCCCLTLSAISLQSLCVYVYSPYSTCFSPLEEQYSTIAGHTSINGWAGIGTGWSGRAEHAASCSYDQEGGGAANHDCVDEIHWMIIIIVIVIINYGLALHTYKHRVIEC